MSTALRLLDDLENHINITINGTTYKVKNSDVPINTSLNTFIRDYAKLSGTKFMCKEGGCGSCIVVVESEDPATKNKDIYAANSCLLNVWSCYGAKVTTIEGAKDKHWNSSKLSLSDQLATKNGSQCGYCSPGMVMNMYGLLKSKGSMITEQDVEDGFAGNICRCTGYKPILEAFRSLVNPSLTNGCCEQDIEDSVCAVRCPLKKRCESTDDEDFEALFVENALASPAFKIKFKNGCWYHPTTIEEILEIFDQIDNGTYMLINGNTAQGVNPELFRDTSVDNYIDLRGVADLHTTSISKSGIQVGANITLTDFLRVLSQAYTNKNYAHLFQYAIELEEHVKLVANVPVRSTGTIAGNLSIKYDLLHKSKEPMMFQSDIFLLLATVGAKLSIVDVSESYTVSLSKYLQRPSMHKKIITKVWLPPLDSTIYKIRTYKIMPRTQNAPASVNAGFLFKIRKPNSTIIETARVVYGGIHETFVHASTLETHLKNKDFSSEKLLQDSIAALKIDLKKVLEKPPALPSTFRRQLAINLFYKTVLWLNQKNVNSLYKSGSKKLELTRQPSSGKSVISTKQTDARGKQIPKLEAYIQTKGEAEYVNDIPVIHNQLYAAFVVAPKGPGILSKIDHHKALAMPGVVQFYCAQDIPGKNSLYATTLLTPEPEELFASNNVLYAGQPVGLIVAKTQDLAVIAARLVHVKVLMSEKEKPLIFINDVLKKYGQDYLHNPRIIQQPSIITSALQLRQLSTDKKKLPKSEDVHDEDTIKVEDTFELGSQYHYTMELQTCVVIPIEDEQLDVHPSTQWPLNIQTAVSRVCNIPDNKVNVHVRRVGGAYGCKITKSSYAAAAVAMAAYLLQKPVRIVMDLETNTKAIGKRATLKCYFKVTVNKNTGKIVTIDKLDFLDGKGITLNDPLNYFIVGGAISCYDIYAQAQRVRNFAVKTDLPSSAWCRAPGTLEGICAIEYIMNKITSVLNKPNLNPLNVRLNNLPQYDTAFINFVNEKIKEINYEKQIADVKDFNKNNRWRKRGFAMFPIKFNIDFYFQFYCTVSINGDDGSISIAHGGCEIGQGLNTKAAVAAAFVFGLQDVSNISVKPTNIVYSPNNFMTGGSMASDAISYACMRACKVIKVRLDKLKEDLHLPDDIEWPTLISTANAHTINLNATFMYQPQTEGDPDIGSLNNYGVSGVGASLVEVDILTGQHIVRHTWIWEDCGESLAPLIDLGQIQGAFVMGLGYFTSEELQYDSDKGELLTNRTWNYDPPGAKDIPEIFDIFVEDRQNLGGRLDKTTQKLTTPPYGVTGAKASGEPPLCFALTVLFAIKEAIRSARQDAGLQEKDFDFDPPATIALKVMQSHLDDSQFKITSTN